MDNDIVPELLERINNEFNKKTANSIKLKRLLQQLENGSASYIDVNEYSIEIGKLLSSVFSDYITSESLPEGRMYYNIADRVLNQSLRRNYDLITDYASAAQRQLNINAGLHLKSQIPEFNKDRVEGIVNRLASKTNFEKVTWLLNEPIVTFNQSIVDDFIEKNVDFHHKAGLSPRITRTVVGKSCDWCRNLAGTYKYSEKPDDIYRRHERCRCIVEYDPGNGKKRDVWARKAPTTKHPIKSDDKAYVSDKRSWQKKYSSKSAVVQDSNYWSANGKKYTVNDKTVVLDYSKEEKNMAQLLSKKLGAKVEMIPRVLKPTGIKTPDYLINGIPFDLKQIVGHGNNVVDGAIKSKKGQSHNFIIDFSKTALSKKEVLNQINRAYRNPNRSWLGSIILMYEGKLIDILKRK